MMIVKSPPSLEQSKSDPKEFEAMGRYNEELIRAGVLLDLNGLAEAAKGAKVSFKGAERTVIDGPFAEAKEMVAGYWIIEVRSLEEAVAWAKRAPFSTEVLRVKTSRSRSDRSWRPTISRRSGRRPGRPSKRPSSERRARSFARPLRRRSAVARLVSLM